MYTKILSMSLEAWGLFMFINWPWNSHFSISVIKSTMNEETHRKSIYLGLQWERIRVHDGGGKSWQQEQLTSWTTGRKEKVHWSQQWSFKTSEPTSSDMPSPTRPYLLILPKEFYKLRPEYWNIWASGDYSHSSHHTPEFSSWSLQRY